MSALTSRWRDEDAETDNHGNFGISQHPRWSSG